MEEFKKVEHLVEHLKEYLDTRISVVKLEIAERVSRVIAWAIAAVFIFFVLLIVIVFLGLSAAHAVGDALGRPFLGYLVIGALYLLVAYVVWWRKEKLLRIPLMNAIIRQMFPTDNGEGNERG